MESDKSRIEHLKQSLYSRDESRVPKDKRTPVTGSVADVSKDWGSPQALDFSYDPMANKQNNSFFGKFLGFSIGFFLLTIGIALFIFFGGINMISSNNVDVAIAGPSSISSGEELDLGVSIVNENRTQLNDAVLFVTYPDGISSLSTTTDALSREKVSFGAIEKGSLKNYTLRSVALGEKGSVKTITFRLEYSVEGSNATFSKEKTYDVTIGSSPLLVDLSYQKEVNFGQEVVLNIDVTSNASVVVSNTLVKVEYPYGFTYTDSNIKPIRNNTVWNIGDLKGGEKKTLVVRGKLVGQNMEERSFRVTLGTEDGTAINDFKTPLASALATVAIKKSFFNLSFLPADGEEGLVSQIGNKVSMSIKWQNTLSDRLVNNQIKVKLSGNVFDPNSVTVSGSGVYRSADNTIVWDKNSLADLKEILPGEQGETSFSVGSFVNQNLLRNIKNPHIDMTVGLVGNKVGTDTSQVTSDGDATIKFESTPRVFVESLRGVGPFANTGIVPPKPDKETTYTIRWTVTNTTNDLSNAVLYATLPSNIVWKDEMSPANEDISYNPDTRRVTWNIGTVSSGTGFSFSPKQAYFKVGYTPNVTEVGSVTQLLSQTIFSAKDTYTETTLKTSGDGATTKFSDPTFKSGDDVVK